MKSFKKDSETKEPQYQIPFDVYKSKGLVHLGPITSHVWRTDPRRLGFLLARYKFCSKMLSGKSRVLEIGCGDGFAIDVILQEVKHVHAVDFDPLFIKEAQLRNGIRTDRSFEVADFTQTFIEGPFDAAYSLDVIEHISKSNEDVFLKNICKSLKPEGVCIIGTPSIESQTYASEWSKAGHINCKSGSELKAFLSRHFYNVFIFSMNDEVVHVGFWPMAHYIFGMGVGVKR
ncbi:MAG: methyltransferase [Deltaproteobacteria bacterium RIFCSPLOWO2_01_44_7]|nr:MAG: methyltransferase [Deltaproteobacteria bacterium RIFCSPHIGHO2_01_FULL_43_49]OGQ15072.1 MAG: methyltransferase [Deltaproteobacteria bacterium RIFCSPHIGHO2_02_FULL_44_53]OGQ27308.1 MAG: methyltransferase [Deltaproteobacteria bacterium RIFCSPHIGHO2_12_FULL_44_21]OGQ31589.1 MAG: methyltransferase [Deltaproteobacteria bacterium RIFCSPLOWO2_01_FULL_45_74]OGQ38185.1 MAG: methyltransferase [Deltaproteobacteria bacterium RIFCSPLOWO2_01_44_7]OGQ42790.1 MAG: methyltransferase [Deltaproteobacteria